MHYRKAGKVRSSACTFSFLLATSDMDFIKKVGKDTLTKHGVMGTELDRKIMDACSNKPWGASTTMLADIAQATYDYQEYPIVMGAVWRKVGEAKKNWRIVYKALSLLDHLVRNGSERAVEDARDHS